MAYIGSCQKPPKPSLSTQGVPCVPGAVSPLIADSGVTKPGAPWCPPSSFKCHGSCTRVSTRFYHWRQAAATTRLPLPRLPSPEGDGLGAVSSLCFGGTALQAPVHTRPPPGRVLAARALPVCFCPPPEVAACPHHRVGALASPHRGQHSVAHCLFPAPWSRCPVEEDSQRAEGKLVLFQGLGTCGPSASSVPEAAGWAALGNLPGPGTGRPAASVCDVAQVLPPRDGRPRPFVQLFWAALPGHAVC